MGRCLHSPIALVPAAVILNADDPIVLPPARTFSAVESPLLFEHFSFRSGALRKQR